MRASDNPLPNPFSGPPVHELTSSINTLRQALAGESGLGIGFPRRNLTEGTSEHSCGPAALTRGVVIVARGLLHRAMPRLLHCLGQRNTAAGGFRQIA